MNKVKMRNMPMPTAPEGALNSQNLSSGFVSAVLAVTGPPIIILEAAVNGNFTIEQTVLWMFSVYFFGGLFSIILPLYYRIPIVGAHSITGVAFLATVTSHVSYSELIGSFIVSSLLIFLVGFFGLFSKLMKYIPKEIIAAMMAGIIISYVVRLIDAVQQLPLIGGVSLLTFFVFAKLKVRFPPVIAAIFAGFLMLYLHMTLKVQE